MSRFLSLSLALFFVSTSSAFAEDGREAAERVCRGLTFHDRINECLRVVRDAEHFDKGAVEVCGGLTFHDRITSCLRAIRDRYYTPTAVATCRGLTFHDRIIECFESSGRRRASGESFDKAFVSANVREALRALRDGETRRAERLLETVLEGLGR